MSTMDIISQLHSMSEQELVTVNSALVDQLATCSVLVIESDLVRWEDEESEAIRLVS